MKTNKHVIDEINTAFNEGNDAAFYANCTDDIKWNIVGETILNGKEEIKNFMGNGTPPKFTTLDTIDGGDKIVSHGEMMMKNKDGGEDKYSFCDVYHFVNGKVQEMLTFMVKHKSQD